MFGITFLGAADEPLALQGLLLPPGYDGHPLRKDHWLAARQEKRWPGAKEPGESDRDATPSRRRLRPPGVPGVTP
jgi:NADH-quinone oxidoreductase subunit C